MQLTPTLRAVTRRGALVTASLFLLGMAGVTQPTVELVAPSQVGAGETVEIVLRVRNDHPKPITFELSGRPVGFDIVITGADGKEVWRRMDGRFVGAALMLLTLQPGEARDFTARWGQVDGAGRAVAPGRYTVRGILPMGARRMATAERDLIIR
jgi:Intracellular proteinase inhibitor